MTSNGLLRVEADFHSGTDIASEPTVLGAVDASLSLVSPVRVLHQMMVEKGSGKLIVHDPRDPSVNWQVCIGNGQIHFATSSLGQFERLNYLRQYCEQAGTSGQSDYQFLCSQWQAGRLTLAQVREFLVLITQDTLIQILKLPKAVIRVERLLKLDPILMSVPLASLLTPVRYVLRQWRQIQAEIPSPLHRPFIKDRVLWHQILHAPGSAPPRLHFVATCLERNFCLYQIAQQMGVPVLEIVPLIQALIRKGVIEMRPYLVPSEVRPTIVCLDISLNVQTCVKTALEAVGYHVLGLMDPNYVWSALARYQPAMLLIDVDHFESYGLMKMLLRSEHFQAMPIVTLTERQGLMNRFRARRAGATDCLTKPLEPSVLCSLTMQLTGLCAA